MPGGGGEGITLPHGTEAEVAGIAPEDAAIAEGDADIIGLPRRHGCGNGIADVLAGVLVPSGGPAEIGANTLVEAPLGDRPEEVVGQVEGISRAVIVEAQLDENGRAIGDANLAESTRGVLDPPVRPVAVVHVADGIDDIVVDDQGQALAVCLVLRMLHRCVAESLRAVGCAAAAGVGVVGNVNMRTAVVGKERTGSNVVTYATG